MINTAETGTIDYSKTVEIPSFEVQTKKENEYGSITPPKSVTLERSLRNDLISIGLPLSIGGGAVIALPDIIIPYFDTSIAPNLPHILNFISKIGQ